MTTPSVVFSAPLSGAQLGIWLGQQRSLHSPMYNTAEFLELRGPLNLEFFRQALQTVIAESATLNVKFTLSEAGPMQKFCPADWTLTYLDYSDASAITDSTPLEQARLWMMDDLASTVDLTKGPLFTQALIKLGEQHYCWYQRIHHIACDGFAFALLTQKLAERYSALLDSPMLDSALLHNRLAAAVLSNNQLSENTALDIIQTAAVETFSKVLREDQQYQQSSAYQKDQQFWATYLSGQRKPVSFTASLAAIAKSAIRTSQTIAPQQFIELQQQARSMAVNWPELLIALVALAIYRHTAARETTLGIPVMGRMGSASLRVPAMVMNIIPLRVRFDGALCIRDLITQIARDLKFTRPHQRYRYEQLKRDQQSASLDPAIAREEQALFTAVVNIMPFDRQLNFGNCTVDFHNLSAGPVEDLSFAFVSNQGGGLRFDLDGNPNRYTQPQLHMIQRELLDSLKLLMQQLEQPLLPNIGCLSWLEGEGFSTNLDNFSTTARTTKSATTFPKACVLQKIFHQIQANPAAIALQTEEHTWTYAQLGQKASQCAQALGKSGVNLASESIEKPIVAIALTRSAGAIVTALGSLLTGSAFVFIDPKAPAARNQLLLDNAKPLLLITGPDSPCENLQHNIPSAAITDLVDLDNDDSATADDWAASWQAAQTFCGRAYLIYTSGSTGTPKGVVISHQALAEFVASTARIYQIKSADRVLQFAPLHFDACIEEIFVTLASGARLVLRNEAMLDSMPRFIAQCHAWQISVLDLPTAFWHELAFACATGNIDLPIELRMIIIGGEAVAAERVIQWRERYPDKPVLLNTYGPSEATVIATCANLTDHQQAINIGGPLPGRAVAVVDRDLQIMSKGEVGELLLLGGGLGDGYLDLPVKTGEAFIDITFPWLEQRHDRLELRAYRTGDKVRINADNQIEFIGRLDDQIKISGYRIDPLEIEAALLRLPEIEDAAVVAPCHANGMKYLVAHIVSNRFNDISSLRAALAEQLPAAMLPSVLIVHQKLPHNSSGKIDRQQLLLVSEDVAEVTEVNLATPQQKIIIGVWQEVLGRKNIQPEDDFFRLGGQSLQTIQVANRLSGLLKRDVPVPLLFQFPTVSSLANNLFKGSEQQSLDNIYAPLLADCLEFEMTLPANDRAPAISADAHYPCILLTGATGFVGAHLLQQLLAQTTAKIICTVNADTEATALSRLVQALAQQQLACADFTRVSIVLADLEKPALGLSSEIFDELAQRIDAIIHNAAITSVMRDYRSLRAANALSTGELLRLAAVKAIPFHLISTIAVAPPRSVASTLNEDFVPIHSGLIDGYQQSKWVAEQFVAIAQQKGYPVNLYRLARVVGSAASGYINPKDLVWNIIQTGLRHGALPNLPISEPWTPVDKIAQFIVSDALANPDQGVCNITPLSNVRLAQIYEWLKRSCFRFNLLDLNDWCARIKRDSQLIGAWQDQALPAFFEQRKAFAVTDSAFETAKISNQKFTQKAFAVKLRLPAIDRSMFKTYLRYAIHTKLISPPVAAATAINIKPVIESAEVIHHE